MVSWCSLNYAYEGNPTKIPSKCFEKRFELFFFLFLFLLLIIIDRAGRNYLCRQDLWICVLQITQNNIGYPKSLMINYIKIWINFLVLLCWFKYAFIWKLQRIKFSSKIFKFVFRKLCKIVQVTLNHRLLIT